ncbi:glycosyltransferase family 4 protein [Paenibacillus xanthanilyticus]|uniref:Glycosyltransferase family 4 protein n=1 Tax=Paenibacillus xanthanilyticus TaxID=1783531 RepID=A0ABV8KBF4_9BACL
MKILFTFYNPSGGMETLNRIRCQALGAKGFECHLLYKMGGSGMQNIRNIPTHIVENDKELKDLLARERYDAIVVCTDSYLLESVRQAGYQGCLIYEVQGLGTPETAKQIMIEFEERVRENADAIVYPRTKQLEELMREHLSDLPQYCFDDPLPVGTFGYEAYPPHQAPILGWVGRIEPNKNWREYLELGFRLSVEKPDLQLWMFEDRALSQPSERAAFDALVAKLGLEKRLYQYDCVPHQLMADYYSIIGDSGGFLCSTSIMEGFGYAVAEALLCRCPVLSTDSGGIRRFITHDETGKLYARGNLMEAIEQAGQLMNDRALRERIRDNGVKHISEQFAPSRYTGHFAAMLRQLGVKPKPAESDAKPGIMPRLASARLGISRFVGRAEKDGDTPT